MSLGSPPKDTPPKLHQLSSLADELRVRPPALPPCYLRVTFVCACLVPALCRPPPRARPALRRPLPYMPLLYPCPPHLGHFIVP